MKNYLSLLDETQRSELKQRLVLELFIENFSQDDLLEYFKAATAAQFRALAQWLSEEPNESLYQLAQARYGLVVDTMLQAPEHTPASFFIQGAQILSDFAEQHELD